MTSRLFRGKLFVGKVLYQQGLCIYPKLKEFKTIVVMMKYHSSWWKLNPHFLKNKKGQLLDIDMGPQSDYIQTRKKILPEYVEAVQKEPQFQELKKLLYLGYNLLIADINGPHQESLQYYCDTYEVNPDFIRDHCMDATQDNLNLMFVDPEHPFGHGYCLAMALKQTPFTE